jgi:uncharacterized membrane protein
MNQAHIHLLINHLPIGGTIFGFLVLVAGFLFRSPAIKRTALGLFLGAALLAVPTFLTGEGAEEVVEDLPGISHDQIEQHEELGETYLLLLGILAVVAASTLVTDARGLRIHRFLYGATFIFAVGCIAVAAQVGLSGGEIRHTEIKQKPGQRPHATAFPHDSALRR